MREPHRRPRVRPYRARAHCTPRGQAAALAPVRDGGELRRLAGLQGAEGVRALALGEQETAEVHGEDTECRHRGFQAVRAEAPVGVAYVSHVGASSSFFFINLVLKV